MCVWGGGGGHQVHVLRYYELIYSKRCRHKFVVSLVQFDVLQKEVLRNLVSLTNPDILTTLGYLHVCLSLGNCISTFYPCVSFCVSGTSVCLPLSLSLSLSLSLPFSVSLSLSLSLCRIDRS